MEIVGYEVGETGNPKVTMEAYDFSRVRFTKDMNCSDRTVKRLKLLYENKFIIINSGKTGTTNEYYFPYEFFFNKDKEKAKSAIKKDSNFSFKNKQLKTNNKL